jgi:squalene-hopene/tetraprenyl-beta-curcumene cyclase
MTAGPEIADPLTAGAAQAARRGVEAVLAAQTPEGYWAAPPRPDPERAAEWLLACFCLPGDPPDPERVAAARRAVTSFPARALDSAVRAYAALRVSGSGASAPPLPQWRDRILARGGIDAAGAGLRRTLRLLGLYPTGRVPEIPPEIVDAPRALYALAAPERAQLVALALAGAEGRTSGVTLDELRGRTPPAGFPGAGLRLRSGLARLLGRREQTLQRCAEWARERSRDLPGAVVARILASEALSEDTGAAALSFLRADRNRDTAELLRALAEAGAGPNPRGIAWLAAREIRTPGEWKMQRPDLPPSGWAGASDNPLYPDVPGTAAVLRALGGGSEAAVRAARWLEGMQHSSGGWAVFDAAGDTPRADVTGAVLEALCAAGTDPSAGAVRRGVRFLEEAQEPEGNWCGAGGDILRATCFVLRGLAAAGESDREAHILRAGEWLRSIQNADGGWGEGVSASGGYAPAESGPDTTAWALAGLLASGDTTSGSVQGGVRYLVARQRASGSWSEAGSEPADAFPLLALGAFLKARA